MRYVRNQTHERTLLTNAEGRIMTRTKQNCPPELFTTLTYMHYLGWHHMNRPHYFVVVRRSIKFRSCFISSIRYSAMGFNVSRKWLPVLGFSRIYKLRHIKAEAMNGRIIFHEDVRDLIRVIRKKVHGIFIRRNSCDRFEKFRHDQIRAGAGGAGGPGGGGGRGGPRGGRRGGRAAAARRRRRGGL